MRIEAVIDRLEMGERVTYVAYAVPPYAGGCGLTGDSALKNLRENLLLEDADGDQVNAHHEVVELEL